LLKRAKACGAKFAFYTPLRLPGSVRSVFLKRIAEAMPLRARKIESHIRQARSGALNDSRFGFRFHAQGVHWQSTVEQLWQIWTSRLGLNQELPTRQNLMAENRVPEEEKQLKFTW